jgi:putative solute:sodium symporter small subunit
MAAVAQIILLVLAIWTAVAFVVAVAVGRTLRQLEPVPVPVRQYPVIDLRRVSAR